MFHLVVIVCMTAGTCETVKAPVAYPTQARCAAQAAIIAGMVHGRHHPARPLKYQYTCSAAAKPVRAAKGQVASKER